MLVMHRAPGPWFSCGTTRAQEALTRFQWGSSAGERSVIRVTGILGLMAMAWLVSILRVIPAGFGWEAPRLGACRFGTAAGVTLSGGGRSVGSLWRSSLADLVP